MSSGDLAQKKNTRTGQRELLTGIFTSTLGGTAQLRLGHVSSNLSTIYFDAISVSQYQTRDSSVYNTPSNVFGATWTGNGKRGGAYTFNTTYLKTTLPIVPTTGYTITAWIKLNELGREQHIADFTNNQFYVASNNKLRTSARSTAAGTTSLDKDQWYFVSITRDQTKTTLYLNGNREGEGSTGTNPSNPLVIGNYYGLVGNYGVSGQIDEVRVYNRALSTGEIQMLYYSTLNKTTSGWTFITNRSNLNGTFSYSGWAKDTVNYTGNTETRTINIDSLIPNVPTLVSPASGAYLTTGNAQLRRSAVTDNGVAGLSGYRRQLSTGSNFTPIYFSGRANITGINISSLPETRYYRRTNAYDILNNTSARSTGQSFLVDYTNPTISTGYISSGSTGNNGANLYYIRTINIKSDVNDTGAGISGSSCEYTTGSVRSPAIYTTNACEITGLTYTTTINIQFRVRDIAGNLGTGASQTYLYDATPPSISTLQSPISGTYLNTGTAQLRWSTSTDTGVGLSGYIRQMSTGVNFSTIYMSGNASTTGINILALPDNTYYRRIYAYDRLNSTGGRSSGESFTVDTILPTIADISSDITNGYYSS